MLALVCAGPLGSCPLAPSLAGPAQGIWLNSYNRNLSISPLQLYTRCLVN